VSKDFEAVKTIKADLEKIGQRLAAAEFENAEQSLRVARAALEKAEAAVTLKADLANKQQRLGGEELKKAEQRLESSRAVLKEQRDAFDRKYML
jgi:hypothetical protein